MNGPSLPSSLTVCRSLSTFTHSIPLRYEEGGEWKEPRDEEQKRRVSDGDERRERPITAHSHLFTRIGRLSYRPPSLLVSGLTSPAARFVPHPKGMTGGNEMRERDERRREGTR